MSLIPASYIEKSWRKAIGSLEYGTLTFIAPNGEVTVCKGAQDGPSARFEIKEWEVQRRIMARGDIGLGEEYIAGTWDTDNVEKLISLFLNRHGAANKSFLRVPWTISGPSFASKIDVADSLSFEVFGTW